MNLGGDAGLVAVTGETGSGKSLLVAKLVSIVTGGKASPSLIPTGKDDANDKTTARVDMGECIRCMRLSSALVFLSHIDEQTANPCGNLLSHHQSLCACLFFFFLVVFESVVIRLSGDHLSSFHTAVKTELPNATVFKAQPHDLSVPTTVTLSRTLIRKGDKMGRLSSICEINGVPVKLKTMKTLTAPLVTVVDASAASNALARSVGRIAILDQGVSPELLSRTRTAQKAHRACRRYREELEREMESRMLPRAFTDGEHDDKLLQHWIDEIDSFENRMNTFCQALRREADEETGSSVLQAAQSLADTLWQDSEESTEGSSFSSLQYASLLAFRDALGGIHDQTESSRLALEALGSISSDRSVVAAIERARNHLYDVTANETPDGSNIYTAAETTHDRLNQLEEVLQKCVSSLEADHTGLLAVVESELAELQVSVEDIDNLIAEWNILSRKHGVSPYSLPSCHIALRSELDGSTEAKLLLPRACADEESSLLVYESCCDELSAAREVDADRLSRSVTARMPTLGMESSSLDIQVVTRNRQDTQDDGSNPGSRRMSSTASISSGSTLGHDDVVFRLIHGARPGDNDQSHAGPESARGGPIETVGSSGEKARVLLAIECDLPGAVGASCFQQQQQSDTDRSDMVPPKPLAVIYDEIDAHVGGRAAVAMAGMLIDQSSFGQVISITHSPSVAAVADHHLVIQKQGGRVIDGQRCQPVRAKLVYDLDRRKELARMAAGDVAAEEAQRFADALLREAEDKRKNKTLGP